ncbi:MAG: sodium ion-translocating decarboxylase subunit beta [Clostridia bacterium]|jgi:sodium ion-translocating decarboxylase beta subunit|nr:sodium ion-translocating decarboxylase subunit beta [Clostridia bacterium]
MQLNLLIDFGGIFSNLWESMGLSQGTWQNYVMLLISFVLMFLAIVKKYEPMLLLPIAFGMFLINLPGAEHVLWGTYAEDVEHTYDNVQNRGLLWYFYYGVDKVIYPPIIFLGIGAMTDFGPLIANPKSMLIGAGAQLGIFIAFFGAFLLGFPAAAAAAIAIIGGADGPTAIYVAKILAEDLLPMIAIAAYSYMALIPAIQKPIMRLLTTKKERAIRMKPLRQVSKLERIIFPVAVTLVVGLFLPDAIPLLGMLMLGNLFRESGVVERLSSQAQNGLMNTITIFLGIAVGCKAKGDIFLQPQTLYIILIGVIAFYCGTIGGLLTAKVMCKVTKGQINPLIGSAGVSAVPMAARISEDVGRETDPQNHLLMHAMGPNVAGVIGSALAAGILLACFA